MAPPLNGIGRNTGNVQCSLAFLADVTGRERVRWVSKGNHSYRTGNHLPSQTPCRTRFVRPRFALSRSYWQIHFPIQSELARMSAIARTEDERSEAANRMGDSPFCDCDCA